MTGKFIGNFFLISSKEVLFLDFFVFATGTSLTSSIASLLLFFLAFLYYHYNPQNYLIFFHPNYLN